MNDEQQCRNQSRCRSVPRRPLGHRARRAVTREGDLAPQARRRARHGLPASIRSAERLEVEHLLESQPRAGTRPHSNPRPGPAAMSSSARRWRCRWPSSFTRKAKPKEVRELRRLAARVDTLAAMPTRPLEYAMLRHKAAPPHRGVHAVSGPDRCNREDPRAGVDLTGSAAAPVAEQCTTAPRATLDAFGSHNGERRAAAAMRARTWPSAWSARGSAGAVLPDGPGESPAVLPQRAEAAAPRNPSRRGISLRSAISECLTLPGPSVYSPPRLARPLEG